jgi:hypothetical protein
MPTRSGKSFSIVRRPKLSEDVIPITSIQLPLRASKRGRPPSDAPPPQSASESANKRARKGKKERIREMLAHMQRHVIDSTPMHIQDQNDHNNFSRCVIGRGRSGKPEGASQVSFELAADPISKEYKSELRLNTTTNSNGLRTSSQARTRDLRAVDQMGANGRVKKKAKIQAKERGRENKRSTRRIKGSRKNKEERTDRHRSRKK